MHVGRRDDQVAIGGGGVEGGDAGAGVIGREVRDDFVGSVDVVRGDVFEPVIPVRLLGFSDLVDIFVGKPSVFLF